MMGRFDVHARAFWLPIVGVAAVFALALLSLFAADAHQVLTGAITAVTTLTAGAAGHAAGAARTLAARGSAQPLSEPPPLENGD
jgi:hypothetical protein